MSNLRLIVKNRAIDQYYHEGKTFVEGRKGTEYTLEYYNPTNRRVKVVLSVDGLNVISGDNDWQRGYVVEPYSYLKVPGWRKDNNNVASFVFSSARGSYNQHNDAGHAMNIGVIGAMVFDEVPTPSLTIWREPFRPSYVDAGWATCDNVSLTGAANFGPTYNSVNCVGQSAFTAAGMADHSAEASSNLRSKSAFRAADDAEVKFRAAPEVKVNNVGTGWGANQHFATHEVSYNFQPIARETLTIYYDDERGLRDRGINVRHPVRIDPNPFPKYNDGCPPPKYTYRR